MSIDFAKMKLRAEQEAAKAARNSKGFVKVRWWKPNTGKNNIRLLPPWTQDGPNSGSFYREIHTHWRVGGESAGDNYVCPLTTPDIGGDYCPICEEVDRLKSTKDPADLELAKELRAKTQYLSNVVDLTDPVYTKSDLADWEAGQQEGSDRECPFAVGDTKIQVYGYGSLLFKEILDYFNDEVDLTDLETGFDLVLTKEGEGRTTKYRLRPAPKPTALKVQGGINVLEKLNNLDSLNPVQDLAKMQAALNGVTGAPPAKELQAPTRAPQRLTPAKGKVGKADSIADLEKAMREQLED
jgi:hypothetical protein